MREASLAATVAILALVSIVCITPLPFGSVLTPERTLADLLACLALVAVAFDRGGADRGAGRSTTGPFPGPAAAPAFALAGVGLFGLLQSVPLPRPVLSSLAPSLAAVWQRAGELIGHDPGWLPLSLAPEVSRGVALHWLAVAAAFLAAGQVGRDRLARRALAFALALVALFELLYGGGRWVARRTVIWGVEVPGDPARLRGTYVNADHLGTLFLIALAVAGAWLWWSAQRARRAPVIDHALLWLVLPSAAFLALFTGLAFTGSRAGLLAAMGGALATAAVLVLHHRRWQVGMAAAAVTVLALGGVAALGYRQGFGRLLGTSATEVTWNARLEVYAASLDLWHRSPITGTGLGTFRQAFPLVQPPSVSKEWIHAHSDVLELLVTTGVIGLPLLAWGLWRLLRRAWRVLELAPHSEDRAAGLAALCAVAAVGLHSLVDFGLTMPANAMILAIVCGAACGTPVDDTESDDRGEEDAEPAEPDDWHEDDSDAWGELDEPDAWEEDRSNDWHGEDEPDERDEDDDRDEDNELPGEDDDHPAAGGSSSPRAET